MKSNHVKLSENLEQTEKYLEDAGNLLIRDIERNQNEGTVIQSSYSSVKHRFWPHRWKEIPGMLNIYFFHLQSGNTYTE